MIGDCDGPGIRFHCGGRVTNLTIEEASEIEPEYLKRDDIPAAAQVCGDPVHVDIWSHRPRSELDELQYFPTELVDFYDRKLRISKDMVHILTLHYGFGTMEQITAPVLVSNIPHLICACVVLAESLKRLCGHFPHALLYWRRKSGDLRATYQ